VQERQRFCSTSATWGPTAFIDKPNSVQFNKCPVAHPFRYRLTLACFGKVPPAPFAASEAEQRQPSPEP
jgi:hypothetical protein